MKITVLVSKWVTGLCAVKVFYPITETSGFLTGKWKREKEKLLIKLREIEKRWFRKVYVNRWLGESDIKLSYEFECGK